ncbi:MAG: flagellar basal-body rod protein FlgF [Pirellulales bacterium]|nr:flagellar basal-body rod protein FlgF [Pirellulales bacterium]
MPYGMYISAEGADLQATRLEVLSNNLANVNTVGFKRDVPSFQARLAEAVEQGLVSAGNGELEDIGGGVMLNDIETDWSSGTLKDTGGQFDFAISGKGFFQLQVGGEQLLTRAGNFAVDVNNQLVSQQGFPVLSSDGSPITVDPALGRIEVGRDGKISQVLGTTRSEVAEIGLFSPASLGDLAKRGENMFAPLAAITPVAANERAVLAGYLEESGVEPTTEMMDLIEASRFFEANVNLIQNQDQMLDSLISRLLRA